MAAKRAADSSPYDARIPKRPDLRGEPPTGPSAERRGYDSYRSSVNRRATDPCINPPSIPLVLPVATTRLRTDTGAQALLWGFGESIVAVVLSRLDVDNANQLASSLEIETKRFGNTELNGFVASKNALLAKAQDSLKEKQDRLAKDTTESQSCASQIAALLSESKPGQTTEQLGVIKTLQDENRALRRDYNALQRDLEQLKATIVSLPTTESRISAVEEDNKKLKQTIEITNKDVVEKTVAATVEIESLSERVDGISDPSEDIANLLEGLKIQKASLKRLEDSEQDVKTKVGAQVEEFKAQLDARCDTIGKQVHELNDQFESHCDKVKGHFDEHQEFMGHLEKEIGSIDGEEPGGLWQLTSELDKRIQTVAEGRPYDADSVADTVARLESLLQSHAQQLTSNTQVLEDVKSKTGENAEEYEALFEDLQKQLQALEQNQSLAVRQAKKEYEARIQKLEKNNDRTENPANRDHERRITGLEQAPSQSNNQSNQNFDDAMQAVRQESARYNVKLTDHENEITRVRQSLYFLEDRYNNLTTEEIVAQMCTSFNRHFGFAQYQRTLEKLVKQASDVEGTVKVLRDSMARTEARLNSQEQLTDDRVRPLLQKAEEYLESVESRAHDILTANTKFQEGINQDREKITKDMTKITTDVEKCGLELKEKLSSVDDLQKRLNKHETELEVLIAKQVADRLKIDDNEKELKSTANSFDMLKSTITENHRSRKLKKSKSSDKNSSALTQRSENHLEQEESARSTASSQGDPRPSLSVATNDTINKSMSSPVLGSQRIRLNGPTLMASPTPSAASNNNSAKKHRPSSASRKSIDNTAQPVAKKEIHSIPKLILHNNRLAGRPEVIDLSEEN